MCTKYFSDEGVHKYFNPYNSPVDAYINYMNVLTDFTLRVNKSLEQKIREEQIQLKSMPINVPIKYTTKQVTI